jgi:transcriptional regulator with XRE-family HTH domain
LTEPANTAIVVHMRDGRFDGTAFRARREALGQTRSACAIKANLSESFIKAVELGKSEPGDNNAAALAAAVDLDLTDLTLPKLPPDTSTEHAA